MFKSNLWRRNFLILSPARRNNLRRFLSRLATATAMILVAGHSLDTAFSQETTSMTSTETNVDWKNWRGPENSGSIAGGDYPKTLDKNSATWKTELPGKGCSTPIVYHSKIYLTAPDGGKDAVVCLDADGKQQWITHFGDQNAGKHRNGSGSNASPTTDGKAVFVYFKSGTFAALELDGSVRWKKNLIDLYGDSNLYWDHGTSPC